MDSFCVRGFLHKFAVCDETIDHHTRIINGWTEITPDNVEEIKSIEKYKITCLDNSYLIEFEAEGEFRKFCCKTRDEVKEFVYEYWLDEVDACGHVEVEAKIKICE